MAYNLRTGLIGSGDIDVNVSLSGLTAANITSGVFDSARIPTLDNSKISDLDAAKLTGTIASGRLNLLHTDIPTLPKTHIETDNTWQVSEIPSIPSDKITSLVATKLTGEIDDARIPNLSATRITSGTFASSDRIPTLPSSKIDPATTFAKSMINTAGEWPLGDIPDLPATKVTSGLFDIARIPGLSAGYITSGQLDAARIPDLSATKITSDTLNAARIPNLDAAKITSGTIDSARLPSTHDILDYNAINGDYLVNSIGNTYTTIDSSLRSNNVVTVPSSAMIEVSLTLYYNGLSSYNLLGRLVDGGTDYEYVDQVINNANLSQSTDNTLVAEGASSPSGYTTVKWTLKFASSQVGDDIDIEPQLKVDYPGATIAVRSGLNTSSGVCFPSTIFKITALPTTTSMLMYSGF
jgi:hypothetical protein